MLKRGRDLLAFGLFVAAAAGCGRTDGTSTMAGDPPTPGDYDYREFITFTDVDQVPWSGNNFGSPFLAEVMSHTSDRYLESTPTTNAHETMHGLQSEIKLGFHHSVREGHREQTLG